LSGFQHWLREIVRVALVFIAFFAMGQLLGLGSESIVLASVVILLYWSYQLWLIQRWLDDPNLPPPISTGLWGRVFDQIYLVKRKYQGDQSQLAYALNFLEQSSSSVRDASIIVDVQARITWANPAAGELLGIEFPRDRGQPVLDLVKSPVLKRYFQDKEQIGPLREALGKEKNRVYQYEISLFDSGDRLIFIRDVTETHRLETMRREFVGNVSHELRTPLTVIRGYLDTLADIDELQQERIAKPLQQMNAQTDRMELLLSDLLLLSKIDSFETQLKTDRIDLKPIVESVLEDLGKTYPSPKIESALQDNCVVLGDAAELKSAINNLVENALKYGEGKSPTVALTKKGGEVVFAVSDQGPGITNEQLPRLTERFYRTDTSRSQRIPGTGLGLAIVKHVANAHRADLDIQTTLGEGSTFSLVFTTTVV